MERRHFLAKAAVGTAAVALTAACADDKKGKPAAQGASSVQTGDDVVKWRMASSFPKGEDNIFAGAIKFADRLRGITAGRFDIQLYAPGELVAAMGVVDAVQQGTIECCHTCSYYFNDRDRTFSLGTGVPFGLNGRQFNAWWHHAGGRELLDAFYAQYHILNFPAGNVSPQMSGWFKKEVKSIADFKGLKIRTAGLSVEILSRVGAVGVSMPVVDVYAALERGELDVAEYLGPYDDEKLSFHKAAPYYYSPGWQEPNATIHIFVNKSEWEKLSKEFQQAFEAAAGECNVAQQAFYDVKNSQALERLVSSGGVQLRALSDEILDALFQAARSIYEEEAAKNAEFAKIWQSQESFQRLSNAWLVPTEVRMDSFIQSRLK